MQAQILDPTIISMDDFVEWYQREPFEYDNGEYIRIMAPQITRSGRTGGQIFRKFADFVEEHNLGEVFSEVPFVLVLDTSQWVKGSRTPDVMFYNAERMQAISADPDWEDKPIIGAPDFVIEIISPTDHYTKVMSKIAGYLRDGVRLAWLVDPKERTVTVCTPNNHYILINDLDATLETTDIIAGFKITLRGLLNL